MQQSPVTDKTLGVRQANYYHEIKQRAKEEETIRKTKKNKQEKTPKFDIGETIVITNGGIKDKDYQLVEIIDVDTIARHCDYTYYGIIHKTTLKTDIRLGKLISFHESNGWFNWQPANVKDTNINWTFILEKTHE
jgi:hypothetical protein